jgi:hypothetical protein
MHNSLIILPALAFMLLSWIFARKAGGRDLFEGLIKAHIVTFAFIAVSTEVFSLMEAISLPGLLTAWILFPLACFVAATLSMQLRIKVDVLPVLQRKTYLEMLLAGAIIFILAETFVTAILYPPNNWDSMTYHMSRVVHWISNKNVSFYSTAITRQNYQMPLAEFAIMHLQIISGSDLYANLVQWVSFLVIICLGFNIAVELGLGRKQQVISAVVVATLPMAILQASSTQNDLVVSSFIMAFGLFMLRMQKTLSPENVLFAAIALGLALLTKGTAYLYCAAMGISLAIPVLIRSGTDRNLTRYPGFYYPADKIPMLLKSRIEFGHLLKASTAFSLIIIGALLLNIGHFTRNYNMYGHPLSTESKMYQNTDMSVPRLIVNTARNGALHLGTPSEYINRYLYGAMKLVFRSHLNDPKTTWGGTSFRISYSRHEDTAGNFVHMLIAFICCLCLPILWFRRHYSKTMWYTLGLIFGTILYCWMLRWQPWASRLHTPLFVMASPLIAVAITTIFANYAIRSYFSYLIILIMVLYSIPFALDNSTRSLISLEWMHKDRMQLYFQSRKEVFNDYRSVMNAFSEKDPEEVGLYIGLDDYEYPLWVFAKQSVKNGTSRSFRHVGVNNISSIDDKDDSMPKHVISTKDISDWKHAEKYAITYLSKHVSAFRKIEYN